MQLSANQMEARAVACLYFDWFRWPVKKEMIARLTNEDLTRHVFFFL